ncbi:MAG TPA: thioesterase [Rhodospirillaceae bacterium]|nr:thioesterase [Rhodospirillaceae bacterium]HCS70574.1 thioesterase [Rhodospirillaceae bacterium]|tara:strand:+ start:71 stop:517 length:447 start_codon:yes stop_codon:yes gene_type:complete
MSGTTVDLRQVPLSAYPYRIEIPTRFGDNDMLGHANNVAYNRYVEAVVTQFQMQEAGVDYARHRIAPVAVETLCRFHRSLSYPETVHAGLRVGRLGNSSVTFLIGLFGASNRDAPAATGHFIHVYSDRDAETAVPMPDAARAVYERFR